MPLTMESGVLSLRVRSKPVGLVQARAVAVGGAWLAQDDALRGTAAVPHLRAFCARHSDRLRATSVVVRVAPLRYVRTPRSCGPYSTATMVPLRGRRHRGVQDQQTVAVGARQQTGVAADRRNVGVTLVRSTGIASSGAVTGRLGKRRLGHSNRELFDVPPRRVKILAAVKRPLGKPVGSGRRVGVIALPLTGFLLSRLSRLVAHSRSLQPPDGARDALGHCLFAFVRGEGDVA